jgi:hypothetical protein
MSDPIDPGTPAPPPPQPLPTRPFEAAPRATPGGCGTPLLIGCGILTVVLAIAVVVFLMKATSILAYAMEKLEQQVLANLPAEVGDAERERLAAGFDAARARIRSGRLDPERLQSLQALLIDAAGKAEKKTLDRADVAALTASLEEFAAAEPEDGEERARPAPQAAPAPDV